MEKFRPKIRWWSLVDSRLLAHYSETLEVWDDRFVMRRGILSKNETVIPFSSITNYSSQQSFFDRVFNICRLVIETAGSINPELDLRGYPEKLLEVFADAVDDDI